MASYKHLLGTPLERYQSKSKNQRNGSAAAYQFTPIGQQDVDMEFSILNSGNNRKANHLLNTVSKPSRSQRAGRMGEDSPVSDAFDTFSTSTPLISFNKDRNADLDKENHFKPNDLLNHSSNPLKQQQDTIDHLKAENYGLKIKIASLTKYLDVNTPVEIRNLINENGDLKMDVGQLNIQVERLQATVKELEGNQKESPANHVDSSATLNNESLTNHIDILNEEKRELQNKIEKLQQQNEALSTTNHGNDDIKVLHDQMEDLEYELRSKDHEIEQKNLELEQLQGKCQRLEDMKSEDLKENDQLEEALIDKNEEIKKLTKTLSKREKEIDKFQKEIYDFKMSNNDNNAEVNSLKNKLMKQESENSNLKLKLKSLEGNGTSTTKKVEKLLKETKEKSDRINKLTSEIREYESRLSLNEDEIEKLTSYIESLRNQLSSRTQYASYSANYELEDEIGRLREVENGLRDELSHYKLKVVELEALLEEQKSFGDSTFLNNVAQVELERDQAYDDLKVYEDHIVELETKLDSAILDIETCQSQLRQSDSEIIGLKSQNDSLRREVDNYRNGHSITDKTTRKRGGFFSFWNGATDVEDEEEPSKVVGESASLRKLTKERDDLRDEIKSLQLKVRHLEEDLQSQRSSKFIGTYEKEEIKRLAKQKNDLEVLIENKNISFESQINDYKQRIAQLAGEVSSKESEIEKLKTQQEAVDKDEHLKLLKDNIEKEKQNVLLNHEKDSLKQQYEKKIESLTKEMEQLKCDDTSEEIKKKDIEIKHLNEKLVTAEDSKNDLYQAMKSKQNELSESLKTTQEELGKIKENYKKVFKRYRALKGHDDSNNSITYNVTGEDEMVKKLDAKDNELQILKDEYNMMRKDMGDRLKSLRSSKDSLSKELQMMKKNTAQKTAVSNEKLISYYEGKLHTLENKVQLYREKFHKELYLSQDLLFMNRYIMTSVKKSNKMAISDLNKFAKVGIYPDYEILKSKKLTFKAVAKGVLAAVRIKNKWLKAQQKTKSLKDIQRKIKGTQLKVI